MKTNKGQVLVAFMLLLPLLLLLAALMVDLGISGLENRNTRRNIKDIIEYSIEKTPTEEEINQMINNQIKNIDKKEIEITSDYITITIEKTISLGFTNILNNNIDKIKASYTGYFETGKIERKN